MYCCIRKGEICKGKFLEVLLLLSLETVFSSVLDVCQNVSQQNNRFGKLLLFHEIAAGWVHCRCIIATVDLRKILSYSLDGVSVCFITC